MPVTVLAVLGTAAVAATLVARHGRPAPVARLVLRPSSIPVGTGATVTISATRPSARGGTRALAGALVTFAGRTVRTDARGLARIVVRLATVGAYRATLATGPPAQAVVRAVQRLHVDCSAPYEGDGTAARPWNTLAAANGVRLEPGAWLELRRGSTCHGYLAPRGSGVPGWPIVIGAYGHGRSPKIEADGTAHDAVKLFDESDIVVQDLEITNHGDLRSTRRGIHVIADVPAKVRDIVIRDLYVHDVEGLDTKDFDGDGGIQVDHPSGNVLIEDNLVENVNRSGIWAQGTGRDPRPPNGTPWPSASRNIVIRDNTVLRVGGDGIVPTGTQGALVDGNTVCCGNLRGRVGVQYDAGIWTFDAIGTVIEHNDVYGMLGGEADGTGGDTTTTAALRNAGSFKFMNNIVVATRPQSTPFPCGPNCSHNLFWGLPPAGHDALQADPLFTGDPPGTGSHRAALAASRAIAREFELRPASPALGAGADVPYSAAGDFFGNPIPAPPAIGCCQPKSR